MTILTSIIIDAFIIHLIIRNLFNAINPIADLRQPLFRCWWYGGNCQLRQPRIILLCRSHSRLALAAFYLQDRFQSVYSFLIFRLSWSWQWGPLYSLVKPVTRDCTRPRKQTAVSLHRPLPQPRPKAKLQTTPQDHHSLDPTDLKAANAAVTGQATTPPVTSKSEPTLTHHETSITRQISLFPWTNSWRRQGQHRPHWPPHFADRTTRPNTQKLITVSLYFTTHFGSFKPTNHYTRSLSFATHFETPCPANRI